MKIDFKHFNLSNRKFDIARVLLFTQIFLIIATFFDSIFKNIHVSNVFNGNLNIYGESKLAPVLLIFLIFEIITLINQDEKLFIPLRLLNSFLTLLILKEISDVVTRSEVSTAAGTLFGLSVFSSLLNMATGGWFNTLLGGALDPSQIRISPDRRLFGYYIIGFALLLSLIVFVFYLYRRFYKKEKLIKVNNINYHDFIAVFSKNKLLSIATYLVMASQFIPFNIMINTLLPTPAFAAHPLFSSAICIIGFLLLDSILNENTSNIKRYIIIEIMSIVIWNPFSVFKYGSPGFGYILYTLGIGLFVYSLLNIIKLESNR
ncbi:MAG: hypothetical protein E7I91_06875 [Streptococcus mitis]|nr:hypothetical protein [Streptococcus mitis]